MVCQDANTSQYPWLHGGGCSVTGSMCLCDFNISRRSQNIWVAHSWFGSWTIGFSLCCKGYTPIKQINLRSKKELSCAHSWKSRIATPPPTTLFHYLPPPIPHLPISPFTRLIIYGPRTRLCRSLDHSLNILKLKIYKLGRFLYWESAPVNVYRPK